MTASHPAGKDADGQPRKDFWPPPEGSAPPPNESKNPLIKLLMEVSQLHDTRLEDHLLLTNRFNLHICSDYSLRTDKAGKTKCRLEFGSPDSPGKQIRDAPAEVKDKKWFPEYRDD